MSLKLLILFSIFLYSSEGFNFNVSRLLNDIKVIKNELWSDVEVTGDCDTSINLKIRIPREVASNAKEVSIFFANKDKNILEVGMKKKIQGISYVTPYKAIANREADDTTETETETEFTITGSFPGTWLPENTSKISASIIGDGNTYYNYYGIQNFEISIIDLMVVEEYLDFKCSLLENI